MAARTSSARSPTTGVHLAPFHDLDSPGPRGAEGRGRPAVQGHRLRHRQGLRTSSSRLQWHRPPFSRSPPAPVPGGGGLRTFGRPAGPCASSFSDITKRFPGVLANDRISISADRGEVLGLLGENGAGKSTLMNILSGLYKPDSGEIVIDGTSRVFNDPRQAIDAGIGMVHQHFQLVPVFDVVEAVALGAESVTGPLRDLRPQDRRAEAVVELSEQYRLNVNPDAKIEDLPVGVRQRVEILKALYRIATSWCSTSRRPCSRRWRPRSCSGSSAASRRPAPRSSSSPTSSTRSSRSRTTSPSCAVAASPAPCRPEDGDPRDPRQPDGRPRRRAHGRQGPAKPADVVLALRDLHVRDDRQHMVVRRRRPRDPRRRDPRPRGRPGQRPDGARRGDRRAATVRLAARSPSSGTRIDEGDPAPGLRHGRRARPRGPDPRRPDRRDDGRRELHPRHVPPRAVQPGGRLDREAIAERATVARQGLRRPHPVDRDVCGRAVGRQPAEGRRRARVQPARQARHRGAAHPRPRRRLDRVHPPADRSSSATPAPRSSSSAPSSTRCSPWATGWP